MRKIIAFTGLIALAVLLAKPAIAQSRHDVTGVIADSSGIPLQGATVVLLSPADSSLVKFGISNDDGRFEMRRVDAADYVLQVTFVGFESYSRTITVSDENLDTGTINLQERTTELGELVVDAEHVPMLIRGDTLDFNAAAFAAPPNANVEELLKRLPGVEVEDDGSIKAQGEDVKNVLVDGKEFFGDDPKVATKNLPADAVNRVQVYDKQSDMAEFTGVDDGERERTINLDLKDDARQGHFGNVSGGFGAENRYDGRASINRFSPTTQLSFIGNANNVNRGSNNFGGLGGFSFGGMQIIRGGGGGGFGQGGGTGITETLSGGLNFNRDFGERTRLRSSYRLNAAEKTLEGTVQQQQLLGSDLSSMVKESNNDLSENISHALNVYVDRKIADGQDLRFRTNMSLSYSEQARNRFRQTLATDGELENSSSTVQNTESGQLSGNASLTYRNRLNEHGTTLVTEGSLRLSDSDTDADLLSEDRFFARDGSTAVDELSQFQRDTGDLIQHRQEISLSHPIGGGRLIELRGEHRRVLEDQAKSFFDRVDSDLVLNDMLSSGFDRTYTYVEGGLRLNQNRDAVTANVGVDIQQSILDGSIRGRSADIKNSYTHLLPSANIRYSIKQGMYFGLRYLTSTREPSMRELQPFTDNSDPLNVYVGNPDLTPEYSHSLNVNYHFFDRFTFRNLFTYFTVTYTDDPIVSSRTVDDRFRQTRTSVNSDGDWTLRGSVNFGTPLRPLRAKLNLSNSANYTLGTELINGDENDTQILRNTLGVKLENRYKDRFDISARARYTLNVNKYSLNPELDKNYVNSTYTGSATIYIGESWQISSSMDYQLFSREVFGQSQNVPLWNAAITRYVMDGRLEVELAGSDLLDESVGVSYENTATYIEQSEYNALGRTLMMRLKYNLSPVRR